MSTGASAASASAGASAARRRKARRRGIGAFRCTLRSLAPFAARLHDGPGPRARAAKRRRLAAHRGVGRLLSGAGPSRWPERGGDEGAFMNERLGVGVAILSCSFGAGAAVATRYLVGSADPVTIAAIRFGGGALCLWPLALGLRVAWPRGRDQIAVAALGVLFFAVFFVFYNLALRYTTVARGTLALSMLPLMTMAAGAALGIEALTRRKTPGVLIPIGGVAVALATGLAAAPRRRLARRPHHGRRDAVHG